MNSRCAQKARPSPVAKVRWLARYMDERNYIVFELERQSYSVTEYRDGKKTMHMDKKKLSARSDVYSVRMTIDLDRLAVALRPMAAPRS